MISDAPLGALLSGGINSSAVVGLMADLGHTPKTFSIGFDDASYNEVEFARMVARRAGAEHHEEVVAASPELALEALERALDEPLADVSLIPTYAVSRMARRHVTVVISGDGGDEVFAGYDWYRAAALADRYGRIPGPIRWAINSALRRVPPTAKKKGVVNKLKRFSEGVQTGGGLEHLAWLIHAHADEKTAPLPRPAGAARRERGSRAAGALPPRRRPRRRAALPPPVGRHQPLAPRRHPRQGRPRLDGGLARGAQPLPRLRGRRVRRSASRRRCTSRAGCASGCSATRSARSSPRRS